jgi:hypothetical protein
MLIFEQTLRQYASITSLLGQSFSSSKLPAEISIASGYPLPVDVTLLGSTKLSIIFPRLDPLASGEAHSTSPHLTLDDLLANGIADQEDTANSSTHDTTHTSLSITVDILSNADIAIADQNVIPVSEKHPHEQTTTETSEDANSNNNSKEKKEVRKLERALDVCGDLGIWVEWARKQ